VLVYRGQQQLLKYEHFIWIKLTYIYGGQKELIFQVMNIEEFTKSLEAEFEEVEPGTLNPDTHYKSIKGWSSMHALIIIAFVDANFNIILNGADLKSASTIRDLYTIVQEKTK
jgi:acyl carrier protein